MSLYPSLRMIMKYRLILIVTLICTIQLVLSLSLKGQPTIISSELREEINDLIEQAKLEREVGEFRSAAKIYEKAGLKCWENKAYIPAIEYFQEALNIFEKMKDPRAMAEVSHHLGMIHASIYDYYTSLGFLESEIKIREKIGVKGDLVLAFINKSLIFKTIKDYSDAIATVNKALLIAREINNMSLMSNCYGLLTELYESSGDPLKMLHYFKLYRTFHELENQRRAKMGPLVNSNSSIQDPRTNSQNPQLMLQMRKNDLMERKRALDSAQIEIKSIQLELMAIEGTLAEADSFRRELLLQAKKKELVIMNLEQQKRYKNLELDKAKFFRNELIVGLIIVLIIAFVLGRNSQIKKSLNIQLAKKNEEINTHREKILEQNKILEEALESAKAAAVAKSQFLSTMSHEMRTPMNSVIGFTNLLRMEEPLPRQKKYLDTLHFSANHLLYLINDILDFNKIEAGKLEIERNAINLKEMLEHVTNTFSYKCKDQGIELNLRIMTNLHCYVIGDKIRLNQILTNLLGNAVKFTEEGSVTLDIRISSEDETSIVIKFSVIDTGIGIKEDKLDSIFESFTQASTDTTRKYGGTGLGLTITKKLVELHGGMMGVKSQFGEGSTFWFTIPFQRGERFTEAIPSKVDKKTEEIPSLEGMHVLVAEDNHINVVIARKFLKMWKIKMDTAENGKIAAEMVQSKVYDLILMDLQMPEMDGYEATRTIRNMDDPYFKNLPIIAMTANVSPHIETEVKEKGLSGYIPKPFNPKFLFETISQYHLKKEAIC